MFTKEFTSLFISPSLIFFLKMSIPLFLEIVNMNFIFVEKSTFEIYNLEKIFSSSEEKAIKMVLI